MSNKLIDTINTGDCENVISDNIKVENLINWKEVSRTLTTSDNSIRKNKCPKKYEKQVKTLIRLVNLWVKWFK